MSDIYDPRLVKAAELAAMLRSDGLEVHLSKCFFGCATGVAGRKP